MVRETKPKPEKFGFVPADVDYKIINLLIQNGRTTLKEISENIGLSIDAVKDHIDKMKAAGAIDKFTIHINPDFFNLPLSSQVYVKLKNVREELLNKFVRYLKGDPQIITLISVLGSFDIFMVVIAKLPIELEKKKNKIREDFKDLIDDWEETIVSKIYKLEEYRFD